MMRHFLLICITLVALVACKSGGPKGDGSETAGGDAAAMEEKLMVLHDEAMPKLNEINRLTAELNQIRSNVGETPEGKKEYPDGLNQVAEALKLADQAMWDWMKAYSDTKPTIPADQLLSFYTKELEKIKSVNSGIDDSIEKAKSWLATHGTPPAK